MQTTIQPSLDRFVAILSKLPEQLAAISEQHISAKPGPGKWSKKQIIGHLIDSAANNHQRFIRAQYEDVPTIVYDQNKWNALNFYETADTGLLIGLLSTYNQHLVSVIRQIPEENLGKKCNSGNPEPATLAFLINDYVAHFEHHVSQLLN